MGGNYGQAKIVNNIDKEQKKVNITTSKDGEMGKGLHVDAKGKCVEVGEYHIKGREIHGQLCLTIPSIETLEKMNVPLVYEILDGFKSSANKQGMSFKSPDWILSLTGVTKQMDEGDVEPAAARYAAKIRLRRVVEKLAKDVFDLESNIKILDEKNLELESDLEHYKNVAKSVDDTNEEIQEVYSRLMKCGDVIERVHKRLSEMVSGALWKANVGEFLDQTNSLHELLREAKRLTDESVPGALPEAELDEGSGKKPKGKASPAMSGS